MCICFISHFLVCYRLRFPFVDPLLPTLRCLSNGFISVRFLASILPMTWIFKVLNHRSSTCGKARTDIFLDLWLKSINEKCLFCRFCKLGSQSENVLQNDLHPLTQQLIMLFFSHSANSLFDPIRHFHSALGVNQEWVSVKVQFFLFFPFFQRVTNDTTVWHSSPISQAVRQIDQSAQLQHKGLKRK